MFVTSVKVHRYSLEALKPDPETMTKPLPPAAGPRTGDMLSYASPPVGVEEV